MARYSVIEVGCIECNGDGSSYPSFVSGHDDIESAQAAVAAWAAQGYHSDADRFIVDTDLGSVSTPQRPDEDRERQSRNDLTTR